MDFSAMLAHRGSVGNLRPSIFTALNSSSCGPVCILTFYFLYPSFVPASFKSGLQKTLRNFAGFGLAHKPGGNAHNIGIVMLPGQAGHLLFPGNGGTNAFVLVRCNTHT